MYSGNHYQLMSEYSRWMNGKLYAICADITDADRRRDRGAFFRSVHGTLNHLYHGDQAWIGRFTHQPFVATIGHEFFATFEELRMARKKLDDEIVTWAQALSEDWLKSPSTYTSSVDGKTRTLPSWVLVVHMFNHQTHHRGQLTTLLKQLGIDPGETDIPWLPALEI